MIAKLADICTIQSGGTPSRSNKDYWDNGTIPWVKISDFSGKYLDHTSEKITQAGLDGSSAKIFPKGTILYTIFATLGETCILDIDATTNQAIAGLKLNNDSVLLDYLYYYLLSKKDYVNEIGRGVAQNNINMKILREMEIAIPPKGEQSKITDVLNKVYELIALRKEQLAKLDQLVKSRFIELFGTVKNNHQEYPVIKISGCAKLQSGFAFKSSDYLDNGIRLVQISNVNKDTLDWDSINCVPQTFLQKYKDFELHVGDLVLAMTRPVIKSLDAVKIATVSENDVPSLLNQRVGRFIIDITKINSTYLMLCCQMTEFREYVEAMSGNSLQPNISSKQVEDYSIVLPPLELQEQFAAFVEQTDKSKLAIQQSLDKLELLKKSLMQEYFG